MEIYKIVEIQKGDITKLKCDAIVNAANSHLAGGGGVDGAIHRAAGPELSKKCSEIIREIKFLPPGKAVITPAYNIKDVKYIIHTVGPIWQGGNKNEDKILADCYINSLELALKHQIKTIAFPAISTGVYGYPFDKAIEVVFKTLKEYLAKNPGFEKIILIFFSDKEYNFAKEKFEKYSGT